MEDFNVMNELIFGAQQETLRKIHRLNLRNPSYVVKYHTDHNTKYHINEHNSDITDSNPLIEINVFGDKWFFAQMKMGNTIVFCSTLYSLRTHLHLIRSHILSKLSNEYEEEPWIDLIKEIIQRNATLEYQAANTIRTALADLHFRENFWDVHNGRLISHCPIEDWIKDVLPSHLADEHFLLSPDTCIIH